jgi:hypothetical protein
MEAEAKMPPLCPSCDPAVFGRDVPECARGPGDLPLAVVGHKADFEVLAPAVVSHADLPPEVHRADLPLTLLVLVPGLL